MTGAVEESDFFYAPDPSSQLACAIAGNIAMNSGGAHCLKYGVTTNNLLGVTLVLMDGTVVELGGAHLDAAGYDLLGLVCGSEGQLGVVTEASLRILRKPEGARPVLFGFASSEVAGACVSDIIRAGVLPVAIEFMDRPCIRACEAFAHAGYPDVEALLIVEVEGSEGEIADQLARIVAIAGRHGPEVVRESRSAAESALIWKGRKSAFGAMGQIADYICLDGTIPVSELPFVLRRIGELTASYGLGVANVFHAGDGNMHPLILYDANKPGDLEKAEAPRLRHPAALRRGRRLPDRRARRRRREARPDGRAVRAGRPGGAAAGQGRLRSGVAAEPGQGVPAGGERRPAGGMTPASEAELAEAVRAARGPLAIEGGGTRGLGQPVEGERLSTAGLRGITLYEPGALTLVVRAGTPLAEVEAALAAEGQMLPFEPWDGAGADRRERGADGRRHGGGQRLGAAADRGRGLPRPDARRALRRRHRRGGEERRAGDEERHRARPREADGRQPRHARGADRGGLQGAAAAGGDGDAGARRARRRRRRVGRCGRRWRRPAT